MVCLIYIYFSKLFKAFHRVNGAVRVRCAREHCIEIKNDVDVDKEFDHERENTSDLGFVVLTASVEVESDQMTEHVDRADALPVLFYFKHLEISKM